MKKIFILAALFLITGILNAQYRYLAGTLQGVQAGTNSPGTGVVIVRYNTVTKLLEHYGNFRGLTGTVNNQHIHTGAPGVAGPVTIPLNRTGGANAGGLFGSQVLTSAQETDLLAGNMYTNVHSSIFGSGEIRAQLIPTTAGQTEFFNARLSGAQSEPPDSSFANGVVNAIVDKATHTLYLTATYTNLTTLANNAHIHTGPVNTSGAVIIPLIFVAATSGTLDTSRTITTANETDILNGNTYVNIHTATYPAGEIRGQLTQYNQQRFFGGSLQGSQETPPNASAGRGTVIVKYNPANKLLELTGDYQNLTTAISASHIHQAPVGVANPTPSITLVNTGGTTGALTMSATLTTAQETDLLAGNMYANVHSATYPDGELRAQLLPTTVGESQFFADSLQFSQSFPVPAVASTGRGFTTVLLDRITRQIFVTGTFSGLTSNITATHIHGGRTNTSGPVIIPLFFGGTTSGTVTGSAIIDRSSFVDSIIAGFSYLNIHTALNGGGEIRGQLGDVVLPIKLLFFNGYKDQNRIALSWQSAQEQNLKSYKVEEQNNTNGRWISKGTIAANNNTNAASYKFSDVPLAANKGFALYRLKIIDDDGRFIYSQVIKVNYQQSKSELIIFNNPVKGSLRYTITGLSTNEKADVSIIDNNGRIVLKTTASSLLNNELDVSNLSSGIYKFVVRFNSTVLQKSFLK